MKRLLALAALLAATSCRPTVTEPPTSEELAAHVLAGTVKVETSRGHGSGWRAAPDLVITAKHVVEGNLGLVVVTRAQEHCVPKGVLEHPTLDIAFIVVDPKCNTHTLEVSTAKIAEGAEVYVAGNPTSAEFSITRGIVTDADHNVEGEGHHYLLDAVAHPGMSGGPVVDEYGRVIGILVMAMTPDGRSWGGRSYALPLP